MSNIAPSSPKLSSDRTTTAQSNISPVGASDTGRFRQVTAQSPSANQPRPDIFSGSSAFDAWSKDAALQVLEIQRNGAFETINQAIKNIPVPDLTDIIKYTHLHESRLYPLPIISVLQKFSDNFPEKLKNIVSNMEPEKYFSEQDLSGFETETLLHFKYKVSGAGEHYNKGNKGRKKDIKKIYNWLFENKKEKPNYEEYLNSLLKRPTLAAHILSTLPKPDDNIDSVMLELGKNNFITRIDTVIILSKITQKDAYQDWKISDNTQNTVQKTVETLCKNNDVDTDSFINRLDNNIKINPNVSPVPEENKLMKFLRNLVKNKSDNNDTASDEDFLKILKAFYIEIPKIQQADKSIDELCAELQNGKPKKGEKGKGKNVIPQLSETSNPHATPTVQTVPTADSNIEKPVETPKHTDILAQITPRPQETSQAKSVFVPEIDVEALLKSVEQTNAELAALKANSSQGISAQSTNSSGGMPSDDGTSSDNPVQQMPRSASTFSLLGKDGITRSLSPNTVAQKAAEIRTTVPDDMFVVLEKLKQEEAQRVANIIIQAQREQAQREPKKTPTFPVMSDKQKNMLLMMGLDDLTKGELKDIIVKKEEELKDSYTTYQTLKKHYDIKVKECDALRKEECLNKQ